MLSRPFPRQSAAALVIALALLTLLTVMAVAFFSQVHTEMQTSRGFADGVSTRQLADSAVGVVMGQIREATLTPQGAWASQPGMVRVYGENGGASNKVAAFYKLYSSDQMVVSGADVGAGGFDPSQPEAPFGARGWNHLPALYTDLNAPVQVPASNGSGQTVARYPIADPVAAGIVEGFSLEPRADDDSGRPAAMPVRWLYVLRDGTLTAPARASTDGLTALWDPPASADDRRTPSRENPIVGRVAFWTDDETGKVNINTAGGFSLETPPEYKAQPDRYAGSYWDTPRFVTYFDRGDNETDGENRGNPKPNGGGLANTQPAQREYQRYPGHPATTSLGLVFRSLLSTEQIYQVTPRVMPALGADGTLHSSQGGTRRARGFSDINGKIVEDTGFLEIRKDRLYASVDEMLFTPKRANGQRVTQDEALETSQPTITPELLDRLRFFVTAHSRAPELNLQGRPRVTVWPVWDDVNKRSAYDSLIAFCSTIGGKPFEFVRRDPYSPTTDVLIPRNTALLKYLVDLTDQKIPGYGGSLGAKYGKDRDQILAEIFDYVRATNLKDKNVVKAGTVDTRYAPLGIVVPARMQLGSGETKGFGRFPTICEATLVFYNAAEELQDPTKPKNAETNPVVANTMRAWLMFSTFNPMQGYAPVSNPDAEARKIAFEVEFLPKKSGGSSWSVQGPGLGAPTPLGFPSPATKIVQAASGSYWGGRNFGGYEGFMHTMVPGTAATGQASYPLQTPAPGLRFTVEKDPSGLERGFMFFGGRAKVKIKFGAEVVQTMTLDFPDSETTWPIPKFELWTNTNEPGRFWDYWATILPKYGGGPAGLPPSAQALDTRIAWSRQGSGGYSKDILPEYPDGLSYAGRWRQILQPGDTVRSIIPSGGPAGENQDGKSPSAKSGDLRVVALYSEEGGAGDDPRFRPHPDYQTGLRRAQSMRMADGNSCFNFSAATKDLSGESVSTRYGNLVTLATGKNYPADKAGAIAPGINGVRREDGDPGDFDTGLGVFADGAFINKVDEGNFIYRSWDNTNQRWNYMYPYFGTSQYEPPGETYFSPNRQIPSAGMLGSLPARALQRKSWETLCFNPFPLGENHYGLTEPRDHLWLDLFTMPVVEPYAISDSFSTAGKINLNTQLAPFPWIRRTTGLRAALHATRVVAVPADDVAIYKNNALTKNYRYLVDRDATVQAIENQARLFQTKGPEAGFFKSATEICERFLYPLPANTGENKIPVSTDEREIRDFWKTKQLTGDNVREKPYTDLLPRLTTKSNTYTVHLRVQSLRQLRGTKEEDHRQWVERSDAIAGEYRGETTIERYIDPDDRRFDATNAETVRLGDFIDVDKHSIEPAYRYRVVHSKRFLP